MALMGQVEADWLIRVVTDKLDVPFQGHTQWLRIRKLFNYSSVNYKFCSALYLIDEVDIVGSNSDSDDHSSVGSDGGMVVTTKKLSLMDGV